jgi:NADPH:quinone reductase-like Zn-dependent oxidoreductase
LKHCGTLVSIKGQDTENLASEYGVRFEWFFMEPDGAMLADLGALIKDGAVKPVIDSVYTMDETAKAYEALKDGHAVGKIGIAVS